MSNVETYRQLITDAIEQANMSVVIREAIAAAKGRNRSQLIFSLFEAGLRFGLNLLIDHCDVIDVDWPSEYDSHDDSFDPYQIGSDCVEAELSRVIIGLPESDGMDFIMTTHDGVYYRDLKTCAEFEGDVHHE